MYMHTYHTQLINIKRGLAAPNELYIQSSPKEMHREALGEMK